MRKTTSVFRLAATPLAALSIVSACLANEDPFVRVPESSIDRPQDHGVRAHTHFLEWVGAPFHPNEAPPLLAEMPDRGPSMFEMFSGPNGYHPLDLRAAYNVSGNGAGAIAIVDAYDYPNAVADFNTFSAQFGLPQETSKNRTSSSNQVLQVVYASGKQPAGNTSWNEEAALDIQWAHAMAPNAKIYLIECASNNLGDLLPGNSVGAGEPNVHQVSNSWGAGEWSYETYYDSYFVHSGVTFFASTGDAGARTEWPSVSPNVVGCGGTHLTMLSGLYSGEYAWKNGGGGSSTYEPLPAWQKGLGVTKRSAPDISAVADPSSGVAIYWSGGWRVIGGTSVASPVLTGIANASGSNRGGNELSWLYGNKTTTTHDIVLDGTGWNSTTSTYIFPAVAGYDRATGWGSPVSQSSL